MLLSDIFLSVFRFFIFIDVIMLLSAFCLKKEYKIRSDKFVPVCTAPNTLKESYIYVRYCFSSGIIHKKLMFAEDIQGGYNNGQI